jgi:endonuclease G
MKRNIYLLWIGLLTVSFVACRQVNRQQQVSNEPLQEEVEGFYDTRKAGVNETNGSIIKDETKVKMMEIPAPLKNRPEQILRKTGFTISYNKTTKVPNWVAWHLVKSHTYGSNERTFLEFEEDMSVPSPRATDNDYYNSRYDRGHMCPAGDNKWDEDAIRESFLFTNVCPQNHGLNKDSWNDLEKKCRSWAREYGAIDIVCGPIFYGKGQQKTIGRNKVYVPDAFYKVVLCRKGSPKAIGFIYQNRGGYQKMSDCACTVDEVEKITGINFFPALNDDIEDRIEAKARLADW